MSLGEFEEGLAGRPTAAGLKPKYQRVLLKLSGEALMGDLPFGVDPATIRSITAQLKRVHQLGVQVAIVVGGGNFWRGSDASRLLGMDQATADYAGMLATIINALVLRMRSRRTGSLLGSRAPWIFTRSPSRTSGGGQSGTLKRAGLLFLRPEPATHL